MVSFDPETGQIRREMVSGFYYVLEGKLVTISVNGCMNFYNLKDIKNPIKEEKIIESGSIVQIYPHTYIDQDDNEDDQKKTGLFLITHCNSDKPAVAGKYIDSEDNISSSINDNSNKNIKSTQYELIYLDLNSPNPTLEILIDHENFSQFNNNNDSFINQIEFYKKAIIFFTHQGQLYYHNIYPKQPIRKLQSVMNHSVSLIKCVENNLYVTDIRGYVKIFNIPTMKVIMDLGILFSKEIKNEGIKSNIMFMIDIRKQRQIYIMTNKGLVKNLSYEVYKLIEQFNSCNCTSISLECEKNHDHGHGISEDIKVDFFSDM